MEEGKRKAERDRGGWVGGGAGQGEPKALVSAIRNLMHDVESHRLRM